MRSNSLLDTTNQYLCTTITQKTGFLLKNVLIFGIFCVFAIPAKIWCQIDSTAQDTSKIAPLLAADSTSGDSTVLNPGQSLIDSLRATSDFRDKVVYNASDSIVFDVVNDMLYLYGSASVAYEQTSLKAAYIKINLTEETIFAKGVPDENGKEIGTPIFSEGSTEGEYNARAMEYNFRSKKARISAARTQEDEFTVISDTTKRFEDGTIYGKDVIFTTCECEEDEEPDFYFKAKKVKMLPNNSFVTGPIQPVIEGFPLPVFLPFAFVPKLKDGQRSGIILPSYGEAPERGFFLRNLGYYFGLGERYDLLLDGDIYTQGGWRAAANLRYNIRYKFNGRLNFSYGVVRFGENKDGFADPDFSRSNEWRLNWTHSQPINPNTRLSASVNISSRRFLQQVSLNPNDFFTNNLSSSVTFDKRFNYLPFSFNLSMNHRQDLQKETVTVNLPTLTLTMKRLNPFRNLRGKKGLDFLANLGLTYNMRATNQINAVPDSLFLDVLFNPNDTLTLGSGEEQTMVTGNQFVRNGVRHQSSMSTTIKLFDYINISPAVNYNEYWYFETVQKSYDAEDNQVNETMIPGFAAARDFSTSVSASTNFYGIYQFLGKKQFAIRQRFTPNVSYSLRPDFSEPSWGFYERVQRNSLGDVDVYSRFEDGVFGRPSIGESQSIGFGITSALEMKYRTKESFEEDFDESKDKFERGYLLDNLSINSSYNFAADSFNLSPFFISARTSLFDVININASATVDPYQIIPDAENPNNTGGIRVNRFMLAEEGKIGRLTSGQISFNARFSSKKKKQDSKRDQAEEDNDDLNLLQVQNNLQEYVDFDLPWRLSLNYNFSYSKPNLNDANLTQTFRSTGELRFTPKWVIGVSSGYDFRERKITQTQLSINRDLDCWFLSFTWIPFGTLQYYVLTLNIKSNVLSGLKLNKRSQYQDRRIF